jgi:hypothetical protein
MWNVECAITAATRHGLAQRDTHSTLHIPTSSFLIPQCLVQIGDQIGGVFEAD